MKNVLRSIYYFLIELLRINIFRTLYINFKSQPFNIAIKFPILVYGKLVIPMLKGKLLIDAPIETGMIKIGYKYLDLVPAAFLPTQLYLFNGTIIFNGKSIISGGVSLFSSNSIINFGKNVVIGGGSMIKSLDSISIGDNTRIAYENVVFDSNVHYVKNIDSGKISKNKAPIIIGENCWINSRSFIGKGSILPDYTIAAGSSFINKDYSKFGNNIFLAGSPAKPIGDKVQRIFSMNQEAKLNSFFENNDKEFLNEEKGLFLDSNDMFN